MMMMVRKMMIMRIIMITRKMVVTVCDDSDAEEGNNDGLSSAWESSPHP